MKLNSITLFLSYIAIIIVVAAILPTPTEWSPRYGSEHKDPLGTYVLYNRLPDLFSEGDILRSTTPIFNTLQNEVSQENYLFINNSYLADRLDIDHLLQFISKGNNGFIAAENFSEFFKDTIGFDLYNQYYWARPFNQDSSRTNLSLTNRLLMADTGRVHKVLSGSVVTQFDSLGIDAIEALGVGDDEEIVFFRKEIGEGYLYIHLCPAAFSNYELIYENTSKYVSNCLSYLPNGGVIFDDYYKSGKEEQGSLLSVLLKHPPMKWAWNLALFSILLFLIFGARRKSRAIPILKPYQNESLNYIETVGAMHYNHRNNRHIADKRYNQLKNYLHRRYKIQESDWASMNADLFYARTGIPVDRWQSLFAMASQLIKNVEWEVDQLRKFSNELDKIYSEIKSK